MQISEFRDLLANDGFAATFQTMGQYRTELLRALDGLRAQADARQVFYVADDLTPEMVGKGCRVFMSTESFTGCTQALFTHPEASAPGLSEACIRAVKDAVWAECEGFELIDEEARRILSALDSLTRASAATVAESSNARNAVGACLHGVDVRKPCNACAAQQQAEPCPECNGSKTVTFAGDACPVCAQQAESSADAVGGLKAQATITLRQAESLLQFFGGHDAEVAIAQYEGGLIAWCTECPEEGSFWLGKTEVDDELADKGRPQAAQQQAEPGADEPPLGGRWHFGNGVVVCGTLRVFGEDFDTDPSQEFKDQLLQWVCDTLNAAQSGQRAGVTEPKTMVGCAECTDEAGCAWNRRCARSSQGAGIAEEEVRNAARYRWLRERRFYKADNPHTSMYHKGGCDTGWLYLKTLDRNGLDAAIDAAIAAAPTQQQEGE